MKQIELQLRDEIFHYKWYWEESEWQVIEYKQKYCDEQIENRKLSMQVD